MFRCVIIDDDPQAMASLQKYMELYPKLQLVSSYTDPLEALTAMQNSDPVDLVLLDIDMPGINGIELSREIRHKTDKLVFTTGHVKYGYDAFKVHADDYLLKPFTQGEFIISMNKIFAGKTAASKEDFFFVKSKEDNGKMLSVRFKDVVAVESKLNYILIHTLGKQVLTYMSLNEISRLFSDNTDFVQFHRSFIISRLHIESFNGKRIKMNNGLEMSVGDYYRKSYNEFVDRHLLRTEKKR